MWEDMCDIEEKWDGVPNMTDRMSDSILERIDQFWTKSN